MPLARSRTVRRLLAASVTAVSALAIAVLGGPTAPAGAATSLPCDIYGAAGTQCVAAHSTTRALYSAYNGRLYQVTRASDRATKDIGVLATGGYADAASQDSFCAGTTCTITVIYDQSARHNDLYVEGAGDAGPANNPAPADALPVTAGGHQVYGVSFSGIMGYRHTAASGVATGSQPEGMYAVMGGTHVNNRCCFDYGNVEVQLKDTGNGHMDAINFGTECWFGGCAGNGPWVQADLENGLFQSDLGKPRDASYTGNAAPFVTAVLKNNGSSYFAIKDGNAQSGGLTTRYAGGEPTVNGGGYSPMHLEGSIVLGTGGDNSNGSIGSFFEGVMTAGLPSDSAENAVQSNVTSVGYGAATGVTGSLAPSSEMSLRATTSGYTDRYVRHQYDAAVTSSISSSSSSLDKADATWIVRRGLADSSCVSFESRNYPGDFLRHYDYRVLRQPMDGSATSRADATFCPETGKSGSGTSFRSYNYPSRYLRHYDNQLYIASNGGSNAFDASASWAADTTWVVSQPWAP